MKPSQTILSRANALNINYSWAKYLGKKQARKLIRVARPDLWGAQKNATQERVEGLESNAYNIARAAGELDWKKKVNIMVKLAKERGVNRKMSCAIKGTQQSLDQVEMPRFDCFY